MSGPPPLPPGAPPPPPGSPPPLSGSSPPPPSSGPGGYAARAYHRNLPGGKAEGRLSVTPTMVIFDSAASTDRIAMPVDGLQVEQGGALGDQVMFRHPSHPEWVLHCADQRVMKEPALAQVAGVRRQSRAMRRGAGCLLVGCLLLLLFLVGIVYAIIALKDPVVAAAARKVPPTWEQKLGEVAFTHIQQQTRLLDDPALLAELNKIAQPIFDAVPDHEKRHPFKLHIAADEVPNAFALPGGTVVVNSGLIEKADRPEEVAGVLAHEVAHVTKQHSVRALISRAGLALLIQAALGDISGLGALVVQGGEFLLAQSYSRGHEREADEAGWEYLERASIDPRGLVTFFEKLEQLQNSSGQSAQAAMEVLSTHPATGGRIKYLNDKWDKQPNKQAFRQIDMDFAAFQAAVKQAAAGAPRRQRQP